MTNPSVTIISKFRSFILILYDRDFEKRRYYQLPLSIVAPFTNRIFKEVLPDQIKTVQEPWYQIIPHYSQDPPIQRSPLPVGPTSLYAAGYNVDQEPPPRVLVYPKSHILAFTVRLFDLRHELFQGEYTVDDMFLAWAEFLTRRLINKGKIQMHDGPFYYEVLVSPDEVINIHQELLPPDVYEIDGVFRLPQLEKDRERINFRKVSSPPLSERASDAFGNTIVYGRGEQKGNKLFIRAEVYQKLLNDMLLSSNVEEGGYLLGIPYHQSGSSENMDDPEFRWLLEITDVIKAEKAWGSAGLLLFTGDSWSQVARRLDKEFHDKKLVGWFHTHLFQATDEFGLSGMDQDLHRHFLTRPWQIAILINIGLYNQREVRCFQRGPDGDLIECTFEVVEQIEPGKQEQ